MRRPVLLALAWLPTVLCVAAWVPSDRHRVGANGMGIGAFVDVGGFYVAGPQLWGDEPARILVERPPIPGEVEAMSDTTVQRWKPFRSLSINLTGPGSHTLYVVPLWVPTIALALPAAWLTRRYWRRQPPGLCPACGYDLRATPERCPECGTPAAHRVATDGSDRGRGHVTSYPPGQATISRTTRPWTSVRRKSRPA